MALLLSLLDKRARGIAFVVALTLAAFGALARLRVDLSIELFFPKKHESRLDYDRYRATFGLDDAKAIVVVEAPDLFTSEGLARVKALEEEFRAMPEVVGVQGPSTAQDVTSDGASVSLKKLFRAEMSADELAAAKATATTDPMFRYGLAHPDGRSVNVAVTLRREIASVEESRVAFLRKAKPVVARHEAEAKARGIDERLTLSGLPIIRPAFAELVNQDLGKLFPLALAVILGLLYAAFRSAGAVVAAFVTILVAVVWSLAFMAAVGVPLQVMTQLVPTICMIISVSDTVHIVNDARANFARGRAWPEAIRHAVEESAWPCLLTEITIAAGFMSLALNDMTMIQQFGLVTAGAMLLTWLANVTVLPIVLRFVRPSAPPPGSVEGEVPQEGTAKLVARFIAWVETVVFGYPRRVIAVFLAILAVSAVGAVRVGKEYYSYDDLKPGSPLWSDIRRLEERTGGSVPLAVYVEPLPESGFAPGGAMLEPKVLRFLDDVSRELEGKHGAIVKNAGSHVRAIKKAHALLVDEEEAKRSPLPEQRSLAVKELNMVDDPESLRDVLSSDHDAAAVVALVPDHGSSRAEVFLREFRPWLAEHAAAAGVRARLTGIYGIADGIYDSLVRGLALSLAGAVVTSFVLFLFVLRSLRLALIALVPNLAPLVVTLGTMAALGIDVKPGTVVVFSITLVIADDDTIQFLSRFRIRLEELLAEGNPRAHEVATMEILRGTGLPMFITASAVSLGFLTLNASEFVGLHHMGTLLAVSLAAAVFADLFVTPVLLLAWKPSLRVPKIAKR
jgi:predicted RND superfamily exporter protein